MYVRDRDCLQVQLAAAGGALGQEAGHDFGAAHHGRRRQASLAGQIATVGVQHHLDRARPNRRRRRDRPGPTQEAQQRAQGAQRDRMHAATGPTGGDEPDQHRLGQLIGTDALLDQPAVQRLQPSKMDLRRLGGVAEVTQSATQPLRVPRQRRPDQPVLRE